MQMLSSFSSQSESFFSPPAWKSMNILYSGMELAMSCPSQLSMLPRLGFTGIESCFICCWTVVQ